MKPEPSPWFWRLLFALGAALVGSAIASGSILWFAYEAHNPWFEAGGSREQWTDRILWNALGNVFEHSIYAFIFLMLGPFWVHGRRIPIWAAALWSGIFALTVGFVAANWLFGTLDPSTVHTSIDQSRLIFVVFSQRVYVPDYLYLFAAYAIPLSVTLIFSILDAIHRLVRSGTTAIGK